MSSSLPLRDQIADAISQYIGSGGTTSWPDFASQLADHLLASGLVVQPTAPPVDPWDDEQIVEFVNDILDLAPDSWDGDASDSSIAEDFVKHAVSEVERLGGCLRGWCMWVDNEPCDHGYLSEPIASSAAVPEGMTAEKLRGIARRHNASDGSSKAGFQADADRDALRAWADALEPVVVETQP